MSGKRRTWVWIGAQSWPKLPVSWTLDPDGTWVLVTGDGEIGHVRPGPREIEAAFVRELASNERWEEIDPCLIGRLS